jgi:adenylylsulfate kinase
MMTPTNIKWHKQQITREMRANLHGHLGATVWLTGLSASGKSTIANATVNRLHWMGISTFILDGDNLRHGLNKDLGFTPHSRNENIRRIGEVAKLFTDAGIINFVAVISPYEQERQVARFLQEDTFFLIHCHADLHVCETRDPKGLYKKARAGEIERFTGVGAPYEEPKSPNLRLDTGILTIDECSHRIITMLENNNLFNRN